MAARGENYQGTWWTPEMELKNDPNWKIVDGQLVHPTMKLELRDDIKVGSNLIRAYCLTLPPEDGRKILMSSVTTALKQGLGFGDAFVQWAVDETLRKLWMQSLVPDRTYTVAELAQIFDFASTARFQTSEEAAEYGKRAHRLIEIYLKNGDLRWTEMGQEFFIDLKQEPAEVQKSFAAFLKFWKDNHLRTLASEIYVCDVELGIGGTLDFMPVDNNNDLVMIDWKTSKSTQASALLQTLAYARFAEKMGLGWCKRAYVIRLDKYNAAPHVIPVYTNRTEYLERCRQWGRIVGTWRWHKNAWKKEIAPYDPGPDPVAQGIKLPWTDLAAAQAELARQNEEAMADIPF